MSHNLRQKGESYWGGTIKLGLLQVQYVYKKITCAQLSSITGTTVNKQTLLEGTTITHTHTHTEYTQYNNLAQFMQTAP